MKMERQAERIGRMIDEGFDKGRDGACLEASREAVLQTMAQLETGRRLPVRAMAAAAGLLFLLGGGLVWHQLHAPEAIPFRIAGAAAPAALGEWIKSAADEPVPLVFENGSRFRLAGGSEARVIAADTDRVRIELARGTVDADVMGNGRTEWGIDAGPYTVRVLGTRFTTQWHAERKALAVSVRSGRVAVSGGEIRDGVTVVTGQRLTAGHASVRIDNPATADAVPPSAETPTGATREGAATELPPVVAASGARHGGLSGAEKSPLPPHRAARSATRSSDDGVGGEGAAASEVDDLDALWRRAEVARRQADAETAERLFVEIRARYPGTPRAARAAFLLGTAAFDAHGDPAAAEQWFSRYLSEAPRGHFVEEAMGRRMEALVVLGREREAAATARQYLRRYPEGSFAAAATKLSGTP